MGEARGRLAIRGGGGGGDRCSGGEWGGGGEGRGGGRRDRASSRALRQIDKIHRIVLESTPLHYSPENQTHQ